MIIFWRLVLAHFLADFTLQFDIVNRLKRKGILGMIIHCLTHFIVSIALTYNYLGEIWIDWGFIRINGWWVMLIILVFHFVIDEVRAYLLKNLNVKDNTICFLTDQFLHLLVLFMVSPIYNLNEVFFGNEKWIIIITSFVVVTHVTTVLIYFIEKDMAEAMFPTFDEKYFLIFERMVLWGFFFVSGYWWILFMFAWAFQMFYIKYKRIIDLSYANVIISILVTSIFGLMARFVYYGNF